MGRGRVGPKLTQSQPITIPAKTPDSVPHLPSPTLTPNLRRIHPSRRRRRRTTVGRRRRVVSVFGGRRCGG